MRKKNPRTRCERRRLLKCEDVCRFYNAIMSAYADVLQGTDDIVEIRCNVLMDGLELGEYTSDFVCRKADGTYKVRECVVRKNLTRPYTAKLLDASHDYWTRRGVEDWGIVINSKNDAEQ